MTNEEARDYVSVCRMAEHGAPSAADLIDTLADALEAAPEPVVDGDERDALVHIILRYFNPPVAGGGSWRMHPGKAADAILSRYALVPVVERVRAEQREADAQIAESDHSPQGYGVGVLNSGSRSLWYSRGRDQAAAAIRAAIPEEGDR